MSFIKIERIDPNIINNPDAGHIYLGQDNIGLWEKDEFGNITYILSGNTYITIYNSTGVTYYTSGSTSSGTSGISSNGTSGTSGKSGISGTFGTSGSSGNGTSGSSGNGTSGSSGISNDGTSGSSGKNGTSGTSSSSGESGSSGSSGIGLDGTSGSSGIDGGYGGATRRWLLNLSSTTPSAGEMCVSLVGNSLEQFNYLRLHRIDADNDMMDGWLSTWSVGILKIEDRRNLSIVGVYYIHSGSTITKIGGTFYQISDIMVLSASGVVSNGEFLISFVHSDSGTSGSSGNSYNVNGTANYISKFGTNGTSIINTTTPIFELNNKIGIGTETPDATLHINGTFKYVDGNQRNGKMLVSDANGLAHWMAETTIPNFYCTSWQEVKDAVVLINGTYEGGNIYLDDYILMNDSVTWDLTNINFYGFSAYWSFSSGETLDTATGYTITITDGNPTFTDISFNTIWHNSGNLVLQDQPNKTLFILTGTGGARTKIKFENCSFYNVVGGIGTTNNIQITSIHNYTTVSLKFNNCFISSSNYNTPFLYNGFRIGTTTLPSNLTNNKILIVVTNHQLNNTPTDSGNTASSFVITGSTAPNSISRSYTQFTSDESVWVKETNYIGIRTNSIQNVVEKSTVNSNDYFLLSSSSGTDSFNNIKKIKADNFLSMSDFDQNLQIPIGKAVLHRNVMGVDSVGDWREWSDSSGFYIDYCSSISPTVWINKYTVSV